MNNWTHKTLNGVSQVDVGESIDVGKWMVVSRTTAYEDSKILEKESSDEEITTEKISWAKAANANSALLNFAKSQQYYSQEVMQLHIFHSTFMQKRKECTNQADIRQKFEKACK